MYAGAMQVASSTLSDSRPAVIVDGLAARYGGTPQACIEISRRLALDSGISRVVVVARRGSIVSNQLADGPNLRLLELPAAAATELARRLAWEAVRLPRLVDD